MSKASQHESQFTLEQWKTSEIQVFSANTQAEALEMVAHWKKQPNCMRVRWATRCDRVTVTVWTLR
jgi:hypothetical protein